MQKLNQTKYEDRMIYPSSDKNEYILPHKINTDEEFEGMYKEKN